MKQGTNLHVITWSHTIGLRQVRFRSPTMLSIHLVIIYIFIYIVRPTVLAPGWPRATRKRSRPDRGGVRLQLLLCYIYTCSTDMPDVQSSYESRHNYEFRRNESSKGTLEGASPS